MRVLLLRIGVLGVVVVLGWIAMAQAQRGNNSLAAGESAGESTASSDDPSRPRAMPPTDVNPLRASAPPSAQSIPSSAKPAARSPAADPFGLQTQRGGGSPVPSASSFPVRDNVPDAPALGPPASQRNAAEGSQYPPKTAAAERSFGGPALTSGESGPSVNDRLAARPDRAGNRGYERNALPPATVVDAQEPASLPSNPFAKPASATPASRPERGALPGIAATSDSSRAGELAAEVEGTGQPGNQQLEGIQTPQLTIQKSAPKELQVGKPATFRVTVRNIGQVPAGQVEIRDLVPKGTRLIGTTPQAARGPRGEIVWTLGTVRPGEESTVEMQLSPTAEGEIGSVATVHFGADASARSIVTRPQLVVETSAPGKVLIGEQVTLEHHRFQSRLGRSHGRRVG